MSPLSRTIESLSRLWGAEISSSRAAESKRKEMEKQAAATRRAPSPKRKGTTDYSKWDAIDSDDDNDDAPAGRGGEGTGAAGGGDLLGIPGLNVPKVSENDPRVVAAKADPKVQVRAFENGTGGESALGADMHTDAAMKEHCLQEAVLGVVCRTFQGLLK